MPRLYRFLDLFLAILGLCLLSPVFLLIYIFGFLDTGSPIFLQTRVGKDRKGFVLIKFRTMPVGTQSVATHLTDGSSITSFGRLLRKTKLDELPQLINVVRGEMSIVGPRPCLFNQEKLIQYRQHSGVFNVLPGITGLSQVKGIDMSTPELLAKYDSKMIAEMSPGLYLKCIICTMFGRGAGDRVVAQ